MRGRADMRRLQNPRARFGLGRGARARRTTKMGGDRSLTDSRRAVCSLAGAQPECATTLSRKPALRLFPPTGEAGAAHRFGMKRKLERAKGFEPSTPTLARSCSTPELHPHPNSVDQRPPEHPATYAKRCPPLQPLPAQAFSPAAPHPL